MSVPRPLAALAAVLYRRYHASLRLALLLPDGRPSATDAFPYGDQVFAVLERDLFVLGGLARHASFTALVAPGRDGDWATAIAVRLGCRVVRGASGEQGAAALRRLVRELQAAPGPAVIAVDGPRGPAGVAQGGAAACAAVTARPLLPVAAAAHRRLTLPGTWSGLYLPLPFSRVVVAIGEQLPLPHAASPAALERATAELSARLAALAVAARAAAASAHPQ